MSLRLTRVILGVDWLSDQGPRDGFKLSHACHQKQKANYGVHIKTNVEQEHFRTSDETRNSRLFRTIDADPEVCSKPQTETLIGLSVAPK